MREKPYGEGDAEDDGRSVALYWVFENLRAGLTEERFGERTYGKPDMRFKVQEPLAIVELGSSFDPILRPTWRS